MNLIEALRSGRPLRRPIPKHTGSGRNGWLGNRYVLDLLICNQRSVFEPIESPPILVIGETDLLADDWEILPEETITVTKRQVLGVLNTCFSTLIPSHQDEVCRLLGFKDV